jgi:nucleotide-binding universal stress UspA family protein
MITNILIPTDYSEASFNALETAIAIAKRNNASLHLLHINDTVLVPEETYAVKNTHQIGHAIADNIKQRHGVDTKVLFTDGFIGPTIVKLALEIKPDLIVDVANKQFFIGPFSQRIINHARVPVLSVFRTLDN